MPIFIYQSCLQDRGCHAFERPFVDSFETPRRLLHMISLVLMSLTVWMCNGTAEETLAAEPNFPQLVQQAYLKASNTQSGDWFGSAVGVSGDTLVVGARQEDSGASGIGGNQTDNSAPESGAVYVYTHTSEALTQQAYLKGSNPQANDRFGYWVDLEGDTLVVGAPLEDRTGIAYVFTRTGGVWSQQAALKASNARAGDWFGSSVALSGDTLIVGARFEDSGATGIDGSQSDTSAPDSGAAYVFTRAGELWSQQAYLKASNTRAGDQFGFSVDISDNTVVVGARFEDSGATGINGNQADIRAPDSGAAYVFTRIGDVWTQEAYVKASNTGAGDAFGNGVAVAGDSFVVGAPFEDGAATGVEGNPVNNSVPDSGGAYVFRRTNGVWSQEAYVKASNPGAGDAFGFHVAMTPTALAIASVWEDSAATGVNGNQLDDNAPDSGAAYVFTKNDGIWSQLAYLKASNTGAGNWFAGSLAVDATTVVVGANKEGSAAKGIGGNQADSSAPESGAVYVFELQQ
jgi:hypothetical protein